MEKSEEIMYLNLTEGYTFKVMAELFKNMGSVPSFATGLKGLQVIGTSKAEDVLIVIQVPKHNFKKYKSEELKWYEVSSTNLHTILKHTKRKETLELKVLCRNKSYKLCNSASKSKKSISISEISKISFTVAKYNEDCYISATPKEFTKMIKDISAGSDKTTKVISNGKYIKFYCDNGVTEAESTLGEEDEEKKIEVEFSDDEIKQDDKPLRIKIDEELQNQEEEVEDEIPVDDRKLYKQTFTTQLIVKCAKIATSSKQILIYPSHGNALKFKFFILSDAYVEISIKSKEMLED